MDNKFKKLIDNFAPIFSIKYLFNINTGKVDKEIFDDKNSSNNNKKYIKPIMIGDETWVDSDRPKDIDVDNLRSAITNSRYKIGKTMQTNYGTMVNTGLVFSYASNDLGSILPSGIVVSSNDNISSYYLEFYTNYRSNIRNQLKVTVNTASNLESMNLPNNYIGAEFTNDFVESNRFRNTIFMTRVPKINTNYEKFTDRFKNLSFILGWMNDTDEYYKLNHQVFQNYRLPFFTEYGKTTIQLDNTINFTKNQKEYNINTTMGARHDLNDSIDVVGGVNYHSNYGYNYPVFMGIETKGFDVFGIKLKGSVFTTHHNGYNTNIGISMDI